MEETSCAPELVDPAKTATSAPAAKEEAEEEREEEEEEGKRACSTSTRC